MNSDALDDSWGTSDPPPTPRGLPDSLRIANTSIGWTQGRKSDCMNVKWSFLVDCNDEIGHCAYNVTWSESESAVNEPNPWEWVRSERARTGNKERELDWSLCLQCHLIWEWIRSERAKPPVSQGVGEGSEVPQLSSKVSETIPRQSSKYSRAISLCFVSTNPV